VGGGLSTSIFILIWGEPMNEMPGIASLIAVRSKGYQILKRQSQYGLAYF